MDVDSSLIILVDETILDQTRNKHHFLNYAYLKFKIEIMSEFLLCVRPMFNISVFDGLSCHRLASVMISCRLHIMD
jgi:hypothetical protein